MAVVRLEKQKSYFMSRKLEKENPEGAELEE